MDWDDLVELLDGVHSEEHYDVICVTPERLRVYLLGPDAEGSWLAHGIGEEPAQHFHKALLAARWNAPVAVTAPPPPANRCSRGHNQVGKFCYTCYTGVGQ